MALPTLLAGKRIAVLGSASGLGRAVACAAEAAGAEVHGIDAERCFDGLAAFYLADLSDPAALDATVHALPEHLDGIALLPALARGDGRAMLRRGLLAPRHLAQAMAPRLAHGGAVVLRGAPLTPPWADRLPEIRAAMALRHDAVDAFIAQWGLDIEPARLAQTIGWALGGWAMAHCQTWAAQGVRINLLTPASPDGYLPPAIAAAMGAQAQDGTRHAASAALFLLSDLSRGMTGANLATDGGLSAQRLCRDTGL